MKLYILYIILLCTISVTLTKAQISPGDLSKAHADLEGITNCTQCHILGGEVSNDRCLDCHSELKARIVQKRGYHASPEVNNKNCASCHSDHNGRNFEMNRFNADDFNHQLTGYVLTGKHTTIDCRECHKADLIANNDLKENTKTFLGLNQECISCHEDMHQKTLSNDCASCHITESFSPATNFNHNKTDFALSGKHKNVDCVECHRVEQRNGKDFQRFAGVKFQNCTDCHVDIHENKFGNNCLECHSVASFKSTGSSKNFNHEMTGFELLGKHQYVDCKQCHLTNLTDPVAHSKCYSCHKDYHKSEFATTQGNPDCSTCHTVDGFSGSLYTIEQHNESHFTLEEAHMATPCFACHQKNERWSFRNIGVKCVDCHEDVHAGNINEKYYPNQTCESCHSVTQWQDNKFNHDLTKFALTGAHEKVNCMSCHGVEESSVHDRHWNFQNLSMQCVSCHDDEHHRQFERDGETNCLECHTIDTWKSVVFDHNTTAFKLDGKHADVDCRGCHMETEEQGVTFVLYKTKKSECIDCHQ